LTITFRNITLRRSAFDKWYRACSDECFTAGIVTLANVSNNQDPLPSTVTGSPAESSGSAHVGKLVRVVSGPLEGLQGICVETRAMRRSVISVELSGRPVFVELHDEWLALVCDNSDYNCTRTEEPAADQAF
jgi:hypothetical protein